MGYKFQFVTLAGFHALNMSMFHLARGYAQAGMAAYSRLQEEEFAAQGQGYRAVTHQRFVGTGYFDEIAQLDGVQSGLHHFNGLVPGYGTQRWHIATSNSGAGNNSPERTPA